MTESIENEELLGHFLDLSTGICRITEHEIANEGNQSRAYVLAGLLTLHEELVHRELRRAEADADLERASHRLAQAQRLEAIGQLSAGVAHEINTPIQFVSDNTSFVKMGVSRMLQVISACEAVLSAIAAGQPAEEAARAAEQLITKHRIGYLAEQLPAAVEQTEEGLSRIAQIVSAMKELSHPGEKEPQPVSLEAVVNSCVAVTRHEWKLVAEVSVDFGTDLPMVSCIRDELAQVFVNLLVNAGHALADGQAVDPRPGRIDIALRRQGDSVEIAIVDNGVGIPEAIRSKIFDPFFTTKTVGRGTGQGLALVHAVVTRHGGSIHVDSTLGAGTTFTIVLPIAGPPRASAVPGGQPQALCG